MITKVNSIFIIRDESLEKFLSILENNEISLREDKLGVKSISYGIHLPIRLLDTKFNELNLHSLRLAKEKSVLEFIEYFATDKIMEKQTRLLRRLVENYQITKEVIKVNYLLKDNVLKLHICLEGSAGYINIMESLERQGIDYEVITYINLGEKTKLINHHKRVVKQGYVENGENYQLATEPNKIFLYLDELFGFSNNSLTTSYIDVENTIKATMQRIEEHMTDKDLTKYDCKPNSLVKDFETTLKYLEDAVKYEDYISLEILNSFITLANLIIERFKSNDFHYVIMELLGRK